MNFFQKVLLEKEGEVVIDRQSFRLKGKGAHDQGEVIYFNDVKDLAVDGNDTLRFSTFKKEKFVLTDFSNLFESFLKDFFRVRNEFFAEQMFMKAGMLYKEYEGQVEVVTKTDDVLPKGRARIQFYEGSVVIIPETSECFSLHYNFLKSHEFDEDEYVLRLYMDNGTNVHVSKFGSYFEDAKESFELLLGKMYQKIVNHLLELFPGLTPADLLRLAYLVRENKGVSISALKKISDDLPAKVLDLVFAQNPVIREKVQLLRSLAETDQYFYVGFSMQQKPENRDLTVKSWFCCALPQKNVIALGVTSVPNDATVHFFRIAIRPEEKEERLPEKLYEINYSMYILKSDLGPLYRDKREMQKSRFKTALRRLSALRFLRKSYIWRNFGPDIQFLQRDLETVFKRAALTMHTAPSKLPADSAGRREGEIRNPNSNPL
jgi:hypothetical protein